MSSLSPISTQLSLAGLTDGIGEELLRIEDDQAEERRGGNRCTAVCLQARVELRDAIIRALAKGQGTETVAKAFGVSREVVRALKRMVLQSGELDAHKQQIAREATHAVDLLIDRVREEIDQIPKSSFAPLLTSLTNAAQLLSGAPTSRIERVSGDSVSDVQAFLDALPIAERVVEGEKTSPIGGASLGLGGALEIEVSAAASGDILSPALRASTEEGAR